MLGSSVNFNGVFEAYPGMNVAPGGGKIFYVHNLGASALNGLPPGMASTSDGFATSVQNALLMSSAGLRAGRGDKILVLPGHVESIATADAWSNLGTNTDVEIIGLGSGTNRPTFTWTTATSSVLFDSANVQLRNCRLFLAGAHAAGSALTVAAPISVTADGVQIADCEVAWGFQANRIVSIGITTTAAATRLKFNRNYCYAETIAVPTTTFLRLTGTDFLEIDNTDIIGPGSTTAIGPVQQLTTAMLKAKITNSRFQNTLAASTIAFTALAGSTGMVDKCAFGILAAGNGITAGSGMQVTASYQATAGAAGALATG